MSDQDWDWELQQAQTAYTVQSLLEKEGVTEGMKITLDLDFLATPEADAPALFKILKAFGYAAEEVEGGVSVQVPDVPFTVQDIWTHEERVSNMALHRGFTPDGWGFWEP
ncbi:MAG TPA: hypothetical protein VLA51_14015 [Paracoccaceae bacterium]|nr:hypothetical protein [Paracoccaceae bacterium]